MPVTPGSKKWSAQQGVGWHCPWRGPQDQASAEAGAATRSSDRVLAALQTAIGADGITDPRRE
eukprot:5413160-Amphidinium_carterae.1